MKQSCPLHPTLLLTALSRAGHPQPSSEEMMGRGWGAEALNRPPSREGAALTRPLCPPVPQSLGLSHHRLSSLGLVWGHSGNLGKLRPPGAPA